jgi:hypothetical protein
VPGLVLHSSAAGSLKLACTDTKTVAGTMIRMAGRIFDPNTDPSIAVLWSP